jgi:hypothetical protein
MMSYVIARWNHRETYIYIYILNYITNAPTCFSASAPSYGSFDIVFANVIKYSNYIKQ